MRVLTLAALTLVAWLGLRGTMGPAAVVVTVGAALWAATVAQRARTRWRPCPWHHRLAAMVEVGALFVWELLVSNVQQVRLILAPRMRLAPRWIRFETELERPSTRAVLLLLVSLTPGTVAADLRGGCVTIHVLDAGVDPHALEALLRRLERPLRRLEG